MDTRISMFTLGRWIQGCIDLAFKIRGLESPVEVMSHYIRGSAISATYSGFSSLEMVYWTATWKFVYTFTQHYHTDNKISADT